MYRGRVPQSHRTLDSEADYPWSFNPAMSTCHSMCLWDVLNQPSALIRLRKEWSWHSYIVLKFPPSKKLVHYF